MNSEVCIYSYNSRGFSDSKQDFIKDLAYTIGRSSTIICNQENFLLQANEYIVKNTLPMHHVIFNPATKDSLDGRPRNGMFIAIPETIKELVKDV